MSGVRDRRVRPWFFITLTAPSFGSPHHRLIECPCGKSHRAGSGLVGAPLRPDDFRYEEAARWNASAPDLLSAYLRAIRREREAKGWPGGFPRFGAFEYQQRGLLHGHLIIRGSVLGSPAYTEQRLRSIAQAVTGHGMSFGREVAIERVIATDVDAQRRVAAYLSKYLTKSLEDFALGHDSAHGRHLRRLSEAAGRVTDVMARDLLAAADALAERAETQNCDRLRKRATKARERAQRMSASRGRRAAELGFGGHILRKSTGKYAWGVTFSALRQRRRDYAAAHGTKQVERRWVWNFAGVGYDEHHAEEAAHSLAAQLAVIVRSGVAARPPDAWAQELSLIRSAQ
jgi:hypothetical protein